MQAPAEAAEKENVNPENTGKQPRPVGRPRGSLKVLSPQQVRAANAAAARWAKRDRHEDRVRAVLGPQTRCRTSTDSASSLELPPAPPGNGGKRLDDRDILYALRAAHACELERRDGTDVKTSDPLGRAARYCGMGRTRVAELWSEYVDLGGREFPVANDGLHMGLLLLP